MILDSNCNHLDAFLSNDLSDDNRAVFESHLEECPTCHDAMDQQQWIDGLLNSPARVQLERPSATILDSFHVSPTKRQRRIAQAACGLAMAATLLIVLSAWQLNQQAIGPSVVEQHSVATTPPTTTLTPAQSLTTFVPTSDSIVVPLESPSADVTVMQVYPTTDAERRWRLEATLSTNL
jgi:predicted anti-sigma-YlaC factor YlaD